MSDDETRDDPDVEAHRRVHGATDEPEGEGDDVEAHRRVHGATDEGDDRAS